MSDEYRKVSRRSFLGKVIGGAAVGAAAIVVGTQPAAAQTDRDPSDAPGRGRTGITDRDPSDRPGHGRRRRRGTGITDRDPSDRPGNGRGRRRCTDSDPSDRAGAGRRC